jgi:hypothetical protein
LLQWLDPAPLVKIAVQVFLIIFSLFSLPCRIIRLHICPKTLRPNIFKELLPLCFLKLSFSNNWASFVNLYQLIFNLLFYLHFFYLYYSISLPHLKLGPMISFSLIVCPAQTDDLHVFLIIAWHLVFLQRPRLLFVVCPSWLWRIAFPVMTSSKRLSAFGISYLL